MFCFFAPSCSARKDKKLHADAITDRSQCPVLDTRGVTTLISDSGITRYRVKAAVWQIYDKAHPPYWEFPEGIYLENFGPDFEVEASLEADYAYYNDSLKIWTLRGNVHALNLQGETFDTPMLMWNQNTERIYSDSSITITRETSIIHGIGFESNQQMSQYTIHHPTGIIPVKDED